MTSPSAGSTILATQATNLDLLPPLLMWLKFQGSTLWESRWPGSIMLHGASLLHITILEPLKFSRSLRDLLKLDSSHQILIIASSPKSSKREMYLCSQLAWFTSNGILGI
ncbi:unnamed protein product [Linum tenue]|nr:unnamed protein product [Linum tenue]